MFHTLAGAHEQSLRYSILITTCNFLHRHFYILDKEDNVEIIKAVFFRSYFVEMVCMFWPLQFPDPKLDVLLIPWEC